MTLQRRRRHNTEFQFQVFSFHIPDSRKRFCRLASAKSVSRIQFISFQNQLSLGPQNQIPVSSFQFPVSSSSFQIPGARFGGPRTPVQYSRFLTPWASESSFASWRTPHTNTESSFQIWVAQNSVGLHASTCSRFRGHDSGDLARQYRRVQISDSRGWSGRLLCTTQLPDSTFREYRLCRRSDWNRGPIRPQRSPVTRIGPRDTQPTRFHGLARQITKRGAISGFQFTISVSRFGSDMGRNGPYFSVYRPSDYTRKAELSINGHVWV